MTCSFLQSVLHAAPIRQCRRWPQAAEDRSAIAAGILNWQSNANRHSSCINPLPHYTSLELDCNRSYPISNTSHSQRCVHEDRWLGGSRLEFVQTVENCVFFFGMVTYVEIKQLINYAWWGEFPPYRRLRRRGKSVAMPGVESRLPYRLTSYTVNVCVLPYSVDVSKL
jgi:hypothetical protein